MERRTELVKKKLASRVSQAAPGQVLFYSVSGGAHDNKCKFPVRFARREHAEAKFWGSTASLAGCPAPHPTGAGA